MIRAVISDFGGVLTTPLAGSFKAFTERSGFELASLGRAFAVVAQRDGANPLYELECGRMTMARFLEVIESALREELGDDMVLADFAQVLWEGLLPNPPMIELMADLRAEGYRMALLTNNVREWEARWRAMAPIDDLFDVVVDSAFVGMRKPDPAIYELTLQRLGVPAPECLFVDDVDINCEAAEAAGMAAIVYRTPEQAIADIRSALRPAA